MKRFGSNNQKKSRLVGSNHKMPRLRRMMVEGLEERRVKAAYINEFHFDPLFGSKEEDQYLELRGEPNATLGDDMYFVAIESADTSGQVGDIETIIELGGKSFGSNGLMVLLARDDSSGLAGYSVDPNASLYSGGGSISGIPGFSGDSIWNFIQTGSSTYLIIQSDTPPTLDDDIDGDNDGTPDGVYLNWNVMDGFTTFPWVESGRTQRAYASIVFAEDGVGDSVLPGSTVIHTEQQAYAGRIGNSTGYSEDDWLTANTTEIESGEFLFEIERGVFGTPVPPAFSGRDLDHVGAPNWFGSLSGNVFDDLDRDGSKQSEEPALDNVQVSADVAGLNLGWERIEPGDYEDREDMSNVSSFVTLTTAGDDNTPHSFFIRARGDSIEERVFAHEGVDFFNKNRKLRVDFYAPGRGVSINVIGNSLTSTYGRLEIFNKDDESLGFVRTDPLARDEEQVLTMVRETNDIAYAVIYSDEDHLSSSPFGRLDDLRIDPGEFGDFTTSADGSFVLNNLPPATYDITAVGGSDYNPATFQVTVSQTEAQTLDIGLLDKFPELADQTFQVGELTTANTVLETLPINKGYPEQQLAFTFLSGNDDNLFSINPSTFGLILNRTELDFETTPSHTLEIKLEDTSDPTFSDTATIMIDVLNENDSPVVVAQEVNLDENSANETVVATMQGSDQDSGAAGEFLWRIASGNTGGVFQIDANTGVVTVADNTALDYESNPVFDLVIRATDGGSPPAVGEGVLTIRTNNLNEAPTIFDQPLGVLENSAVGTAVAQLTFDDQDLGQTGTWSIIDGDGQDHFHLDEAGRLSVAADAELNFESKSEYTLNVQVTDTGDPALSDTHSFTVSVVDANDAPIIADQTMGVDENSPADTEVGSISAQEEDAGQTLTYSITGGADAAMFAIDSASGTVTVTADAALDFEAQGSATIEVTATDDGQPQPLSSTATITIEINNVNEPPTIAVDNVSLDENSPAGASAGKVDGADPDADDLLNYEILAQSQDWLTIDALNGDLSVMDGADIDFESGEQNVVSLKVTDQGGLSAEATVTISVNDVNDAPQLDVPLADTSVRLGETLSYQVPEDAFTDQDAGDSLRFVATDGLGFGLPLWLSFDSETRTLSGTPTENELGVVEVKVTAVDNSRANASDIFQVEVLPEPFPWHNSSEPFDANNDGFVSPIDALIIINYLNSDAGSEVPSNSDPSFGYIDANGDNFVTPIDALIVINELNNPTGEGEFVDQSRAQLPIFDLLDDDDEDQELLILLAQEQIASSGIR